VVVDTLPTPLILKPTPLILMPIRITNQSLPLALPLYPLPLILLPTNAVVHTMAVPSTSQPLAGVVGVVGAEVRAVAGDDVVSEGAFVFRVIRP